MKHIVNGPLLYIILHYITFINYIMGCDADISYIFKRLLKQHHIYNVHLYLNE